MAADVYANESHKGRGGWTWYTGSAGWMYQFIISSLFGIELKNNKLQFRPCFPLDWPSVSVSYRYKSATYRITVFQLTNKDESWWKENNKKMEGDALLLSDDALEHVVEIHVNVTMKRVLLPAKN